MRFRPANISLINRRHYLPRLLLTLSSIEKDDQRLLTGHYISMSGWPVNHELCLVQYFFDRRLPQGLPNIDAYLLNGIVSIAESIPLGRVGLCPACHICRPGGNHCGTRLLKAGD